MPTEKISVSLGEPTVEFLDGLGPNRSGNIQRSLKRYANMLRRIRAVLRHKFTDSERLVMIEILEKCGDVLFDDGYPVNFANSAIAEELANGEWTDVGIRPNVLREKLIDMDYIENAVFIDAVERYLTVEARTGQRPAIGDLFDNRYFA